MMQAESCLSRSTAHGLLNIGNSRQMSGKIIWGVLTTLMLSFFVYHIILLHDLLVDEKMLVVTFPDALPFIQPDIVFCLEMFLARDYINDPPKEEYEFMLNVSRTIKALDRSYHYTLRKTDVFIWDYINANLLFRAFFHRKHQLFLSIKCNQKDVNLKDVEVEMNFVHFACYRLKPAACRMESPMDTLIVKFYTHIYGVNLTYSALDVSVDDKTIDRYSFVRKDEDDEMEDGIHVYLVQPYEAIGEGTTKITASVAQHTSIQIRSTEYNRVSTRKSTCQPQRLYSLIYNMLEEDYRNNPVKVTTESLCREIKFQEVINRFAKCTMKRFPIPLTIPDNFTFCGDRFTKISDDGTFVILIPFWNDHYEKRRAMSACKATMSCQSTRYVASVNSNPWPRNLIMRSLFTKEISRKVKELTNKNLSCPGLREALNDFRHNKSNLESWKRNLVKISISPGEFMSNKVEESIAYSYRNFFSDIGGLMGCYMGASLLTLCELIRLCLCCVRSLRRSEHQEELSQAQKFVEQDL